jgi:hypothetical protein
MGQTDNFVLDELGKARYSYWAYFLGAAPRFMDTQISACRLLPSGELQQLPLPPQTAGYGEWTLQDGQLPFMRTSGRNEQTGFRWNGEKFVPVSSQRNAQVHDDAALSSDDEEEDDGSPGFLTPAARKAFKAAGRRYRHLTGYETKAMPATCQSP